MKINMASALCANLLLVFAGSIHIVHAQGTDFSYSSYLTRNGSVASDGLYDLEFKLYDAVTGGTQVGATQVRNPVQIKNGLFTVVVGFGAGIFNGQKLWLQVGVRTAGSGSLYEYYQSRQELMPTPYAIFAASAGGGGGGSQWLNSGSAIYYDSGNVGIGTDTPQAKLQINTDEEGIRIQGNAILDQNKATITFRAPGNDFPPVPSSRIGYVGDASADDYDVSLHADIGDIKLTTSAGTVLTASSLGKVGIGTSSPAAPLHIEGSQAFERLLSTDTPNGSVLELFNTTPYGPDLGTPLFGAINFGDGVNVPGQIAYSSDNTMIFRVGNAEPMRIGDCTVSVRVLQITGGCDLAEPFEMSTRQISKGAVVVIDEDHPGQLKLSAHAYDTRVAGIVSGANGIKPGISLHQEGALGGGENVALSGRVYALADASDVPIKPGDLLTTSETPGHCMKVIDHTRAQGAIIGKAMSSLQKGKGMVLVLVSLQ